MACCYVPTPADRPTQKLRLSRNSALTAAMLYVLADWLCQRCTPLTPPHVTGLQHDVLAFWGL